MEKPDWTYEPIPKDVFPPRVQEALEALREKMDEIEGEELKIAGKTEIFHLCKHYCKSV